MERKRIRTDRIVSRNGRRLSLRGRERKREREREKEKIGEERGASYARTDRKEIGRDPRAASRTITNEIASLGLSPPTHCVARHSEPDDHRIKYNRARRKGDYNSIDRRRNGRGSSSIRIQSQSTPGQGISLFVPGSLRTRERERSLTFWVSLIIVARFVDYLRFTIFDRRFGKWSTKMIQFFFNADKREESVRRGKIYRVIYTHCG